MNAQQHPPCDCCATCNARLERIESGVARIAQFTTTLETIISGLMRAKGRAGNIIRDALTNPE